MIHFNILTYKFDLCIYTFIFPKILKTLNDGMEPKIVLKKILSLKNYFLRPVGSYV